MADIVPAVSKQRYSSQDPIVIYSRGLREERDNYPRNHYTKGVAKQDQSKGTYKSTVRLFKRWVRQYSSLNAPSFYIECAVHSVATVEYSCRQ